MEQEKVSELMNGVKVTGKKIGTLTLYIDDSDKHLDLSSGFFTAKNGDYELWIRPNADNHLAGHSLTNHEFQTVIAHELGHFLATLSNDPTHSSLMHVFLPTYGEVRAWQLAEQIKPDLDKGIKAIAYSKLDDPESVEKRMNEILAKQ